MENQIDWTKFNRRIYIDSDMQEVYDAWTVPDRIEEWFLEAAAFVNPSGAEMPSINNCQAGDTYQWKWHNWDNIEKGEVLEANGKDFLKFTFAGGTVSIKLTEEDEMTCLDLVQEGIGEDDKSRYNIFYGCSLGWSFWMVNLKAWLEFGVTLNETRPISNNGMHLVNS